MDASSFGIVGGGGGGGGGWFESAFAFGGSVVVGVGSHFRVALNTGLFLELLASHRTLSGNLVGNLTAL
jgi:hypothetical protein